MYKDFLDKVDNLLKFESEDFLIFDSNVKSNKDTFSISVQFSPEYQEIERDHLINQIKSEIKRNFYKQIFKSMTSNNHFIDLRGLKFIDAHNKTSSVLNNFNFKNLVTNMRICAELQDSTSFHFSKMKTNRTHDIYEIGKYLNFEAYCDPYIKYADEVIYLFDDVRFNAEGFKYEIVNEMTFTPKLKITYDFYYETPNSDTVYLFDDEFQKSLSILISQMRDEKIDQLLGE
jgi:hypothetical protein